MANESCQQAFEKGQLFRRGQIGRQLMRHAGSRCQLVSEEASMVAGIVGEF
jgi:hypothetical protein